MVLITGCNGLVGSYVARTFLQHGCRVRALKRTNSDLQLLYDVADQIEWLEGDILDPPQLTKAVSGVDQVVHAAAIVSFAPKDRERMLKVNVEGTANVINACLAAHIDRFCFVSSVAALGRTKNQTHFTEQAKWENSSANSHYALTKYLAELEVWRGIAEGLAGVIVNPSLVLGAGDWNKSSARLFKYVWEEHPFYTEGHINYIDVRDVADVIFRLIYSEITAERFILNAGTSTYREVFSKIAAQFGKRKPAIRITPWLAAVAWRTEYVRSWFTGKAPLVTRETALLAQRQYAYDNEKIRQTLGYTFRPLDETITWACGALRPAEQK